MINNQILKSFSILLKYNKLLVEFKTNERKSFHTFFYSYFARDVTTTGWRARTSFYNVYLLEEWICSRINLLAESLLWNCGQMSAKLARVTSSVFKVGMVMRFLSSVHVLFMSEKIRSRGAFVPARHMVNWQRRPTFLNGISLLLKCANISTLCRRRPLRLTDTHTHCLSTWV